MKNRRRKLLGLMLALELAGGSLFSAVPAFADTTPAAGTPYRSNGTYDVTVPHVFINQVYGGGTEAADDTYSSNGFIELYNPTADTVSLEGWSLWYADTGSGKNGSGTSGKGGVSGPWQKLDLSGTVPARSSYLIVGKDTGASEGNRKIDLGGQGDLTFDRFINNKGLKVVLMSNTTADLTGIVNPFLTKPAGYVDMLGTGSNDSGSLIDGYETAFPSGDDEGTSKKKAVRRITLADTDNNKADFEQVDYSSADSATVTGKGPRYTQNGAWESPLVIASGALPDAYVGLPYSAHVVAGGGTRPYDYQSSGLPAGLALNSVTGTIYGTPTTVGPAAVTVSVYDSADPQARADKTYTINVQPAAEEIRDTLSVTKVGHYEVGVTSEDGGVAEIVKYNKDNGKFYLVNGSTNPPTLEIVGLKVGSGAMTKDASIDVRTLSETDGFLYGDLTSVDINTTTKRVSVSVQEADPDKKGKILVLDYEGHLLKTYEAGVQPDMIKSTSDGRYILTADEGEPRHAGTDPHGSVTIVDTVDNTVTHVEFDDPSVIDDRVHIRGASNSDGAVTGEGPKADAIFDLEPEYLALSADNTTVYATLQENNAIAVIDIAEKKVKAVHGLGFKDLSDPNNALDLVKDGAYRPEAVPFYGMYMPDGIASYTTDDGRTYLFTANEGDVTEWDGRTNGMDLKDLKGQLTAGPAAEFLADKTQYNKVEVAGDMEKGNVYLYGGRSFSIWSADGVLSQVYDSGNDFEKMTAQRLPTYFNANHTNNEFDGRSAKKGPEPEDVKTGKVGNREFVFVGLERIGGIMTYDVTDPAHPVFANYINTRDFSAGLETDAGPEGIEFIPAAVSPTGQPLLLVAHEVGGTVSVLQLNVTKVELNKKSLTLTAGGASEQLTATVTPVGGGAATATWSSSDDSVATVDANGNVTPVAAGHAVIWAVSADGYGSNDAEVTVHSVDGEGPWKLTVMHTNDTHAHLADVAKRTTLVNQVRAESGDSLLLDAGDVFSGDLYFTKWLGQADLEFMNYMGYDAMTFGNHEFDQGTLPLSEFVRNAKFPLLSSNIDFTNDANISPLLKAPASMNAYENNGRTTDVAGVYPYITLDVNGHEVGVFGLTTEDTEQTSSPGDGVVFQEATAAATATVQAMQQAGIDKIIAITHLGYGRDQQLAEEVEGIDLIVGGHTHTKLDAPEVVTDAVHQTPTVIVQANEWGKFLGRVDVTFDKDGNVLTGQDPNGNERLTGRLIPVDATVAEDPMAKSMLKPYNDALIEMQTEVIGATTVVLDGERQNVRSGETNLGNFIADAMLAKGKALKNAQISVQNGGGIRASIDEGDITMGELRTVMPFGNTLYVMDVTGAQLLAGLENGVSGATEVDLPGKFPQVGGMKFKWDPQQPAGSRVFDVSVQNGASFEPLDLTKTYRIVTNSFMANGGDGYVSFAEAIANNAYHEDLGFPDYANFIDYVKELGGTIAPAVEGRIVRATKPTGDGGGDDGSDNEDDGDNGAGNGGTGNGGGSTPGGSNGGTTGSGGTGGTNGGTNAGGSDGASVNTVVLDASALEVKTETNAAGQTVNTVTVGADALQAAIAGAQSAGSGSQTVIVINVTGVSGPTAVDLPASALTGADGSSNTVIAISTSEASYQLPLSILNVPGLDADNASFRVTITPADSATMQNLSAAAGQLGADMGSMQAISFEVSVTSNGTTTELNDFGTTYVVRVLYVPATVDAGATAVLFDPATNEFSFVPSVVTTVDGKPAVVAQRPGNSIYTVLSYSKSFDDLNGHWSKKDVETLVSKLIVKGVSDTEFAPDWAITRAEFTTLLVTGLGMSEEAAATFDDVKASDWFAGYVGKAAEVGLVQGKEEGKFAPNDTITRAELAVMVSRALAIVDKTGQAGTAGTGALSAFADRAAIPDWAAAAIASLADKDIMNGSEAGFVPAGQATRAEAAVTLLRALRSIDFVN